MAPWKAAALAACAWLWGCDPFSTRPFEARPERLRPENDVFADTSVRDFIWTEYVDGPTADSPLVFRSLRLIVRDEGDTLTANGLLRRLTFQTGDGSSPPVSAVSALGFDPARLALDSSVRDAGPSLPFPEIPQSGWRVEIQSGDLRFLRKFLGLDTLDRPEGLVESFAFAESTYWDGRPVAAARYWFGRRGLLRQTSTWPDFGTGGGSSPLRREISVP